MHLDASKAVGAYAAAMTLAVLWLGLTGVQAPASVGGTIDVQRINVREPDGTLRLAISNHALMPGIWQGGREYPHPNRPEAGMIFYDDEGTENGGLVFDGGLHNGRPSNSGSFTFDRYRQDQTLQLVSTEDGSRRRVGLVVNDRPDLPLDIPAASRLSQVPAGPMRDAAAAAAGIGRAQRAWLGRDDDGAAALVLNDGSGHPRLKLIVSAAGNAEIDLLDAAGRISRRIQ